MKLSGFFDVNPEKIMTATPIYEIVRPMSDSTILNYLLFLPGFFLLLKGADWLVQGAISLARRMQISDLVIGLTLVSMGTSAPELAVNISASYQGSPDLAIGNVLGSNAANILLILGVCAVIRPLTVTDSTVWKEIPFSLLAAGLVVILANDLYLNGEGRNVIARNDGLVLWGFFIIFFYYIFSLARNGHYAPDDDMPESGLSIPRSVIYVIVGLIALPVGGHWIVNGAVEIARAFQISESFIGVTVLAIGTSLPELAASGMATYRGNSELAIGNVVGSNIFNILFVLATSAVLLPLPFSLDSNIDALVVVLASLMLFSFLFIGRRNVLDRGQGVVFLVFYIVYIGFRYSGG